jgi:hypothetical protein
MMETIEPTNFILPSADKMTSTVTDSINRHLDIARGRASLHTLYSSLSTAGIDVFGHQTEAALTANGPDEVGAIAMGDADATFTYTCKAVFSLISPPPLLDATI